MQPVQPVGFRVRECAQILHVGEFPVRVARKDLLHYQPDDLPEHSRQYQVSRVHRFVGCRNVDGRLFFAQAESSIQMIFERVPEKFPDVVQMGDAVRRAGAGG